MLKPTSIAEGAHGYARLLELVGNPAEALVVMEATGHYSQRRTVTRPFGHLVIWLLESWTTGLGTPSQGRRWMEVLDRAAWLPDAEVGTKIWNHAVQNVGRARQVVERLVSRQGLEPWTP